MKLYKLLLISVFPLLSACFQVQLVGNVGESTLRVSELRDPAVEIGGMVESWGPDAWIEVTGEQAWAEYGPTLQQALLGMAINSRDGVDAETLYLAQATAGNDYDPTGSLRLSTPAVVQGSWHAIVPGEQLQKRGDLKVSALTEAAYQVVREDLDILSDEEILARLNAVAQLLLDNVDDDETVDYKDLLLWSRGQDAASYRGDLAELDALAAAVSAGQPAAMLTSQARTVLGSHRVVMDTNFGTIEMETLNFDAPITVVNFLAYVNANFYDNIIFHRTINNFVIQAGRWELVGSNRVPKEPNDPILNESRNGISNARGTVAMARLPEPHSAASQFYINQAANANLDYDFESDDWGYAVFARVTRGLDVVDAIAALPTSTIPGIGNAVPNSNVVIRSMTVRD